MIHTDILVLKRTMGLECGTDGLERDQHGNGLERSSASLDAGVHTLPHGPAGFCTAVSGTSEDSVPFPVLKEKKKVRQVKGCELW